MFLGGLLLEAGQGTFSLSFRLGSRGSFVVGLLGLSGVHHLHYLVVDSGTVVVLNGSEGVGLVSVDNGHGSEVLAELIEIVIAVEEGTALTEESLEILDGDGVLVDVVDFEFA